MLKLSKKIDYGLVLLRALCLDHSAASAREVAARYRLPPSMAANILKALAAAGILDSTRGSHGGYELARHPGSISLAEVIEALEGPFTLVDCIGDDACCEFTPVCPTHDPMQVVHRRFKEFMAGLTLDEVLALAPPAVPVRMSGNEDAYLP